MHVNRIDQKFQDLRQRKRKAFIAFITAGDPDLNTTQHLVFALEKAGVDIIELGVPFSDPLADGATIQAASHRALAQGTTVPKIFDAVKRIRERSAIPIALMTYYNPVFAYGEETFIETCQTMGVDGVIIPDLPPEEAGVLRRRAAQCGVSTVFFIAPTTTNDRIITNAKASTGFVYYLSLTGVTGAKHAVVGDVVKDIARAKRFTDKPICAGFGINSPGQARAIAQVADGVIVGSAIIQEIQRLSGQHDLCDRITRYVASLVKAIR